MSDFPEGAVAVIFVSRRNAADPTGYGLAAQAMEEEAEQQPGYLGIDSARSPDGAGITVSYWASEADAIAWRDQARHRAIREQGRADWYDNYHMIVAAITRDYRWARR
jgi:heme-degrading monooxygenase HmoA